MSGHGANGRPDAPQRTLDLDATRLREAGYVWEVGGVTHDGAGVRTIGWWRGPKGHIYLTRGEALIAAGWRGVPRD